MYVVLGRFQPFHKGHALLIEAALELGEVVIAIGSAQAGYEPENPWTSEERESMIRAWLGDRSASIVAIDDINDPPNWVDHATKFHGEGVLVTSDEATKKLYEDSGWDVNWVDLSNRDTLEGWRVRTTLKMLSTVYDDDAVKVVMSETIPEKVVDWLVENDALYRFYDMSKQIEHAG